MKNTKKVQFYWLCIALEAIVFNGCKKDNSDSRVTALFTIDTATGDSPLLVKFTNTSTNSVSYRWNFGDGANSTVKEPTHSFINTSTTSEKRYTVTLIATSADNSSDSCNQVITVNKNRIIFNSDLTYGTMTDREGNVYKTITIGTQIWMAENLRTIIYRNGDTIANIIDSKVWIALNTGACCIYNNTTSNDFISIYGRLYNWYAVADGRNIAPIGWHVPTDTEWTTLISYLGGEGLAAGKMKEVGISHWAKPNTGANNESGFTVLPAGNRFSNDGTFGHFGGYGYWWSSTVYDASGAWGRALSYDVAYCNRYDYLKKYGFTVRLVKD